MQFIIETNAASTRTGSSTSTVTTRKRSVTKHVWFTKSQLSSPFWLDDKEHAEIVAEDGRPRRPYKKSDALAKHGVEEVEFSIEELERIKDNSIAASATISTQLEAEHYCTTLWQVR